MEWIKELKILWPMWMLEIAVAKTPEELREVGEQAQHFITTQITKERNKVLEEAAQESEAFIQEPDTLITKGVNITISAIANNIRTLKDPQV